MWQVLMISTCHVGKDYSLSKKLHVMACGVTWPYIVITNTVDAAVLMVNQAKIKNRQKGIKIKCMTSHLGLQVAVCQSKLILFQETVYNIVQALLIEGKARHAI
jgi:hypothetical protein